MSRKNKVKELKVQLAKAQRFASLLEASRRHHMERGKADGAPQWFLTMDGAPYRIALHPEVENHKARIAKMTPTTPLEASLFDGPTAEDVATRLNALGAPRTVTVESIESVFDRYQALARDMYEKAVAQLREMQA